MTELSDQMPKRLSKDEYDQLPCLDLSKIESEYVWPDGYPPHTNQIDSYEWSEELYDEGADSSEDVWVIRPEADHALWDSVPNGEYPQQSRQVLSGVLNTWYTNSEGHTIPLRDDARLDRLFVPTASPSAIGMYWAQVEEDIRDHLASGDEERRKLAVLMQKNFTQLFQQGVDGTTAEHIDLLNRDIKAVSSRITHGLWLATVSLGEYASLRHTDDVPQVTNYRFAPLRRLMVTGKNNFRSTLYHLNFDRPLVEPVVEFNGDDALLPSGTVLVGPALLRSAENTEFGDDDIDP